MLRQLNQNYDKTGKRRPSIKDPMKMMKDSNPKSGGRKGKVDQDSIREEDEAELLEYE